MANGEVAGGCGWWKDMKAKGWISKGEFEREAEKGQLTKTS